MKKILERMTALLDEVRAEKTKAVKSMDYEKAGIIRNWEKELMALESRIQSEQVALTGSC